MVKDANYTVVILQARMSSSRLPGKVMMLINDEPMISQQIKRIKSATLVDELIVATSTDQSDDVLAKFLGQIGVKVFRGSLDDVLSRFLEIQEEVNPTAIIRLTGDCPLVMPELIDSMVLEFYGSGVDYLSNTLELSYPDGLDIELVKPSALEKLKCLNLSPAEREHVTLGIYNRPLMFSLKNFSGDMDLSQNRWTVDYIEDLNFVRKVYKAFEGHESTFTLRDVLLFLSQNPQIKSAISADRRNEQLGGNND